MSEITADAVVDVGRVTCSRCGSLMKAEAIPDDRHPRVPLLRWCCPVGHTTQAIPLPDSFQAQLRFVNLNPVIFERASIPS